jgi:ornithine carbamoyltransferase
MKKDFVSLADLAPVEIQGLLDEAVQLKAEVKRYGNPPILAGKSLGMIFQKPSLRTRVSFERGMQQLGGSALYLSPDEIGLGKRESVADVARVLSRYVDAIMARVFSHAHILDLAKWASVPVINGLSDYNHPCQGLADLLTVLEHKGAIKGVTLAYVGDSSNVTTSLIFGGAKLGMHVVVASPEGYQPPADVAKLGNQFAAESGGSLTIMADPHAAVRNADVIYTDVWTSMGQEAEREKRLKVFPPYQINARLVSEARKDVIVMHCLPAHRGEEITDDVVDGPHAVVFDEAENRMHAQKAVLVALMGPRR